MPRPLDPTVKTDMQTCETHGLVEFRLHKVGVHPKTGKQKVRWRCPQCHAERNRNK